ncbi:MAG TPA: molybdopterin converting factor subunit 1, partial [Pseudomonadota bacterium]|nr:molybdopterin converting factor subunit 1 [Pseudomonadota bacterium]
MKIAVRYFAHLRERLRRESDSIELADGSTVGDLLLLLGEREPLVAASRRSLQVAVNMEFMPAKTQLKDGDEVALIPPVAGGSALVRLSRQPLQYDEVIAAVSGPGQGGIVLFAGLVRDHNDGKQVVRLDYEAYDEMAVRKMAEIAARIESEQPGVRVAMVHRVGSLQIGDLAVILAASAPHRGEAFAACRAAIEALKVEVP